MLQHETTHEHTSSRAASNGIDIKVSTHPVVVLGTVENYVPRYLGCVPRYCTAVYSDLIRISQMM